MTNYQETGTIIQPKFLAPIEQIHTIVPVKYNGISNQYQVCPQERATHMAILADNSDTPIGCLVTLSDENKGILADLL